RETHAVDGVHGRERPAKDRAPRDEALHQPLGLDERRHAAGSVEFPSPLWGGVRGGGGETMRRGRRARAAPRPPPPPPPHQGGGEMESGPHHPPSPSSGARRQRAQRPPRST